MKFLPSKKSSLLAASLLLISSGVMAAENGRQSQRFESNAAGRRAESTSQLQNAQSNNARPRFTGRIIGGTPVPQGSLNYTAIALPVGCSASIVGDQWILTAGHCNLAPQDITQILVGGSSKADMLAGRVGESMTVAARYLHPSYATGNYDFALIKVNGVINPAYTRLALPTAAVMTAVGKVGDMVTLSGWGALDQDARNYPDIMQTIKLQIVNSSGCAYEGIGASEICAGGLYKKDTCPGDSGGPMVGTVNGVLYNLGVVSRGGVDKYCGEVNVPGIYGRTLSIVGWLNGIMGTAGVQTYSNGTDVAINDNATVESPVVVSGRTGNGSGTTAVAVNIVHTYIGDLKVDLIAPDGSVYVLHNYAGANTQNINKSYTVNLSSEALNGTWKLRVNDNADVDTGYINSWSVKF